MDQPKIERVLRLMTLMSGSVEYTVDELADKLETSYRSIYRYIDTFKACGFAVEKVHGNVYRLAKMSPRYPDLDKLVYFSEEEAYLVNHLIDRLDPTNALKAGLQRKLAAIYSSTSIADYIDKRSNAANVESLSRAVREKKAVRLLRYESGHSGQIRDRHVEPFGFTTNFIDVWAFDLEDGRNKIFKISRMEEVQVLEDEAWTREAEHERLGMDVFRMAGHEEFRVRLRLSMKAKNLLTEEYPLAERDLKQEADGSWILDTGICAAAGVGRFVSGLAGEVQILDGEPLRDYLRDYQKKFPSVFKLYLSEIS